MMSVVLPESGVRRGTKLRENNSTVTHTNITKFIQ